ncbi:hypothetical protein EZV73_00130 [Acidaminobacter sp. JC074]|uniref:hypothetical protein n=1 Tax=Acidaminobacter sp. JC074 TaxID=2530199 RepID=UPI001F105BE3|nr:hypothetical protein [Acidaminobacter sp. JC074]MCH4885945.1 hypothetical protein [Acidaminobacter sp. JC074]
MSFKSQFGYILDLLDISGTEFASTVDVDRTLISKWKNNARPLKARSQYFEPVIKAFIDYNLKRNDTILERFFREIYPNIDRNEPDYLNTCLHKWLIGDDLGYFHSFSDWRSSSEALYTTNIEIFQGNKGKRDALVTFFNYAFELPAGQEIFISDSEKNDWLIEDPDFYQYYYKQIDELAKFGHNITIIYKDSDFHKRVSNFDYYKISKYFTGRVTAYKANNDPHMSPSLYIIHRHMLMLSINAEPQIDNRYISLYRDPFSISQMVKMFASRLKRATPMISTYTSHGTSLKGFTENLIGALEKSDSSYFISSYPPFSTIPEEILKGILSEQTMTDQQTYELMQMHKVNQSLFNKENTTTFDQIISRERLLEALKTGRTRLDDISAIIKKDVYISKDQMLEHLCSLAQRTKKDDHFNITVASFDDIPKLNISMLWLVEDQMMYSFPLNGANHFVVSESKIIIDEVILFVHDLLMLNEEAESLCDYLEKCK